MTTILLVDNHAGFRQSVLRYLTLGGFSVVDAESGAAALEILSKRPDISLLVTDLNMPEINGLELIQRVHAIPSWKHLPILVLSVTGNAETRDAVKKAGAVGFMQKPFSLPEFLESVRSFL